jgi:hypothetical protein
VVEKANAEMLPGEIKQARAFQAPRKTETWLRFIVPWWFNLSV